MSTHPSPAKRAAFSLIELIVVIAIIAIIAAFTVPAASTILRGSKLTQASQIVTDQISLARQTALTRNRSMEVRFIRFGDPETPGESASDPSTGHFRAMQVFEVLESGVAVPLDKPQLLPQSVIMNPSAELSSLIGGSSQKTTKATNSDPELPRGIARNYEYVAFRFLEDGSTNLSPTGGAAAGKWFVTLHNANEKVSGSTPPANFFTLQIDPVSGATKLFRPTVG